MKPCRKCDVTKPLSEFHRSSKASDGLQSWCKDCGRAATREHRRANEDYYRANKRSRYRMKRELAVKALGSKCAMCGITDVRVLEIDHVDGGGHVERQGTMREKFMQDLIDGTRTDCQLLCANCHRIKTYS